MFEESLQKLAGNAEFLLGRLVGVCICANRDRFASVGRLLPGLYEPGDGIRLVKDPGFEIEPGRQVEIAVARPRVAVNAAMLAALIGRSNGTSGDWL